MDPTEIPLYGEQKLYTPEQGDRDAGHSPTALLGRPCSRCRLE